MNFFRRLLRLAGRLGCWRFRFAWRKRAHFKAGSRPARSIVLETLELRLAMIAEGSVYSFADTVIDTSAILGPISAQVDWGDGARTPVAVSSVPAAGTFTVRFDYSFDTAQFFNTPEKQAILQVAADMVFSRFNDSMSAIIPSGTNRWEAVFENPSTGGVVTKSIGNVAANEFVIFVGTRDLPGNAVAIAGPGGTTWNGSAAWGQTVLTRGQTGATGTNQTDFGPWGGSLTVDPFTDWHFGPTTEGLTNDKYDFLSAISHELMHILGFGVSPSWQRSIASGQFVGPASVSANGGGAVPLAGDQAHWREGTQSAGQEALMDPSINSRGIRKLPTPLDLAGLADIGWNLVTQQTRVSGSHTYADDGTYPVKVILSGGRAGERSTPIATVDVGNVVPTINQRSNLLGQANVPISIVDLAVFQDAGFGPTETFESYIDWGDGSPAERGVPTIDRNGSAGVATEGSFDGTHTYTQPGNYNVTYRVNDDNGGFADHTFNVQINPAPELKLTLDRNEIRESSGENAASLQIDTSGLDTSRDNTLSLISSDPSEVAIPATIVIPAGSTRVTVGVKAVDDSLLDGPQTVQITAQMAGLSSQPVSMTVLDSEVVRLEINANQVREDAGAGAAVLRVSRSNTDTENALQVVLTSSNTTAATVPISVTIPPFASSIDVSITAVDDSVIDGVQSVVFTPQATGYFSSSAAMSVLDYEPVQWVEQRISLAESSSSQATTLTITIPAPAPASGTIVSVTADMSDQLQYAPQVVIPAGQTSATVSVSAINDSFAESPKTIRLIASAPGMEFAAIPIDLTDDDRSPWTNSNDVFDTNGDGSIDPIDVLQVVNYLRREGAGLLPSDRGPFGPPYVDINGNGTLEPLDVLLIINALVRRSR